MDKRHLRLICGDPERVLDNIKAPVSFTRFVFPFAYKPRKIKGDNPPFYKEISPRSPLDKDILLQRKKYFTRETGTALYDRAKWLQVPTETWKNSSWAKGVKLKSLQTGKEFLVAMSPPRLVLSEWNQEPEANESDYCPDIFKTGFLVVELWFPEKKGEEENPVFFDDLLDINELFRCFDYPGYEKHLARFLDLLGSVPSDYFEKKVNGRYERVCDLEGDIYAAYFKRWGNLLSIPVKVGDAVYSIVPENFTDNAIRYLKDPEGLGTGKEYPGKHLIYSDYRAYVWSAAVLKDGGKSLGHAFYTSQTRAHEFGHWVRFLNVDEPSGSHPSEFEKQWAKDRTYRRWEHYGTWYGFNYHSGVAVLPTGPYLSHFREIYFDIALLLFYLRITLFRFSNELAEITAKGPPLEEQYEEFKRIREYFSVFTIRYQYPLLSNQQQGIEMYELARRHFDIKDFYEEVKSEIDGTHEYLEMVQANWLSRAAVVLAIWGIPIAFGSLAAGIFGMNWEDVGLYECLSGGGSCMPDWRFWVVTGIVLLLAMGTAFYIREKYNWHFLQGLKDRLHLR